MREPQKYDGMLELSHWIFTFSTGPEVHARARDLRKALDEVCDDGLCHESSLRSARLGVMSRQEQLEAYEKWAREN